VPRFIPYHLDLVREMALAGRVSLVGSDDHDAVGPAQHLGDVAVDGRQSLPDVEEKQDDVGLVDRDLGLRLDRRARFVLRRIHVQPGGVDDRELPSAPLRHAVKAVPGQP